MVITCALFLSILIMIQLTSDELYSFHVSTPMKGLGEHTAAEGVFEQVPSIAQEFAAMDCCGSVHSVVCDEI